MKFEYDHRKSMANLEKHGIDFADAASLWDDPRMIAVEANRNGERRWVALARRWGGYWAAVYTIRGDSIRIIFVRHATKKEASTYEKADR